MLNKKINNDTQKDIKIIDDKLNHKEVNQFSLSMPTKIDNVTKTFNILFIYFNQEIL